MSEYELSSYQKAIMNYVKTQRGNLLVDAKAGSGKTTTLVMVANELTNSGKKCLFLAFNKHIVEELQSKIQSTDCLIKTVHSLGYSFILSYLYKKYGKDNYKVEVDTGKLRALVKEYYEKEFKKRLDMYNATGTVSSDDFVTSDMIYDAPQLSEEEMKALHSDIISDFVSLCNFSRFYNINYREDYIGLRKLAKRFCWHLFSYIDDGVFDDFNELIIAVIDKTKELFEKPEEDMMGKPIIRIDYADMIYFPILYDMRVPYSVKQYCDTVLVDECQDLNILQQKFIRKLDTGYNRFIFVGDKKQAIYAFAGADNHSIEKLDEIFFLQHLPLNICYRCPENIVRLAQPLVPEIEWNRNRPDRGEVKFLTMDEAISQITPDDVLIGRKNKDLLKLYRKFALQLKRPVKFRNTELVNTLINNVDMCISEYIKLYTKGVNIKKPVEEHMATWIKETGNAKGTDLYNTEMQQYGKYLISENSGKSSRKSLSNTNIEFLEVSMKEYKELGDYGAPDDMLTDFYDVILDFLGDYKKAKSSVLINDFKAWLKSFLTGSMYEKVPIISSVHSMKGGEADNVYIYDYPMFPYTAGCHSDDDLQQEKNLKYVAVTRAKKNLYLILCDESDGNERNVELNSTSMAEVKCLLDVKKVKDVEELKMEIPEEEMPF